MGFKYKRQNEKKFNKYIGQNESTVFSFLFSLSFLFKRNGSDKIEYCRVTYTSGSAYDFDSSRSRNLAMFIYSKQNLEQVYFITCGW